MITIKSEKLPYGICFPTSVTEVTADALTALTTGIQLPKHYCIVALAFKTKIFDFCATVNSTRENDVAVVPILAKISDEDSELVNANVGDTLIIARSSLERGVHIHVDTMINAVSAKRYFDSDPELRKDAMSKSSDIQENSIVILEFKICPVTDISASIPMDYHRVDPFMVVETKLN